MRGTGRCFGVASLLLLGACTLSGAFQSPVADSEVQHAIHAFTRRYPRMRDVLRHAYAYAVFPAIRASRVVLKGGYGLGQVFQGGQIVGTASLTQAAPGFQVGGEPYRELVVFLDRKPFTRFVRNRFHLSADVFTHIVSSCASCRTTACYGSPVVPIRPARAIQVWTMIKGDLCVTISVADQSFLYAPD